MSSCVVMTFSLTFFPLVVKRERWVVLAKYALTLYYFYLQNWTCHWRISYLLFINLYSLFIYMFICLFIDNVSSSQWFYKNPQSAGDMFRSGVRDKFLTGMKIETSKNICKCDMTKKNYCLASSYLEHSTKICLTANITLSLGVSSTAY